MKEELRKLLATIIKLNQELSKAFWKFVELYAHERANGRRFDWSKLTEPQPAYYKIGIDQRLISYLMDISGFNNDM
ncbi:MAG: hypothetical protein Q4F70_01850 [Clostridia bacterium]|nr:hypothetical protein [Clostridia bacterium]